jgi:hypothetical protein
MLADQNELLVAAAAEQGWPSWQLGRARAVAAIEGAGITRQALPHGRP